jgi:asparagine synthetase B (glutamine-hydrolysing)
VASRLDALLADDRVPRRLSLQGVTELLCYQRTVADHTQYADIRATPAARIWTAEGDTWDERQTRRLGWRTADFDEAEGAERLAHGMVKAARRRTADAARHGLLLSGGLDARWVMAGACKAGAPVSCLTLASHDNLEVAIARQCAARAGMTFQFLPNPPGQLSANLDAATRASDGLFSAPLNLFGALPKIAESHDVLLSGHGLDYTLRGYYLPCVTPHVAGSVTRLPKLRAIPNGRPKTVADSLRVGIGHSALDDVLSAEVRAGWDERRVSAMTAALDSVDVENPYDAWDAFLLHSLGRHYAYNDFVAMRSVIAHRPVAFDPELFDLYLAMKPEWRASGRMAHAAMKALGPDLMALPDANSGLSANHGFATQILLLFARAAVRRVGLMRSPPLADPTWRLNGLAQNPALLDSGLFEPNGLSRVVDQHLGRQTSHRKLLLQLLTLASWLEQHDYTGLVRDG